MTGSAVVSYKKQHDVIDFTSMPLLTLSRLGRHLVGVLSLAIHISPNNGPINMILSAKPLYYVLPIHFACSSMSIGPLVAKLQ
jgi:hypothetical protein